MSTARTRNTPPRPKRQKPPAAATAAGAAASAGRDGPAEAAAVDLQRELKRELAAVKRMREETERSRAALVAARRGIEAARAELERERAEVETARHEVQAARIALEDEGVVPPPTRPRPAAPVAQRRVPGARHPGRSDSVAFGVALAALMVPAATAVLVVLDAL